MTYNVFSGTLNPTHFTSLHFRPLRLGEEKKEEEERKKKETTGQKYNGPPIT